MKKIFNIACNYNSFLYKNKSFININSKQFSNVCKVDNPYTQEVR